MKPPGLVAAALARRVVFAGMSLVRRSVDGDLQALFEESGHNVLRTTTLLRDLLADYPERAALADQVRK